MKPIVVCITGASGAIYAVRLLEIAASDEFDLRLSISPAGALVLQQELNLRIDLDRFEIAQLFEGIGVDYYQPKRPEGRIIYHHHADLMAPIASGSFLTRGMIIAPCSGGTMSAVVTGASNNLIQRAADVHLKERRPLILMPRETPLSLLQLENMTRARRLGAVVLPAMPGWYHEPRSPLDLVDFVVARILDQLDVPNRLISRWGKADEG
jgi:4-hydroxy-3-polyprenylbenzoate decarboxylase